jgi:hypothetical protein
MRRLFPENIDGYIFLNYLVQQSFMNSRRYWREFRRSPDEDYLGSRLTNAIQSLAAQACISTGSRYQAQRTIFVLEDLGKTDWLPMLNIPGSKIPTVLILRGNRNLQSLKQHRFFSLIFSTLVFRMGSLSMS